MAQKKCPKCGYMLPEEARFCGKCRRDVSDVRPKGIGIPPAGSSGAVASNGGKGKVIAGVVIALAVLLLAMNLHVCAMCGKPFVGQAYYYATGKSGDLLDSGCAERYYGPVVNSWKA